MTAIPRLSGDGGESPRHKERGLLNSCEESLGVFMRFKAGVCNLCGTGCGHFLQTDASTVSGVAPSWNHPVSKGKLCVRGWHIHELMHSGGRIETPLIRENGTLKAATYGEATERILQKLATLEHPEKQTGIIASARSSNEDNYLLMKLARTVLHTNNIGVSAQSGHDNSLGSLEAAFGMAGSIGSLSAIDTAQYIFVIGCDITKLNPIVGSNIHLAAARGARVMTLSSAKTQMAELSHKHFQQKPGTKRLVINACAKALGELREKDPAFGAKHLPGYQEYMDTLSQMPPSTVAVSGLSYIDIKEEMKLLAAADSIVILFSSGISGLDRETIDAITNFSLLTGKMGGEGSALIPMAGICNLQGSFDMGLAAGHTVGFKPIDDPKTSAALAKACGENIDAKAGHCVFDLLASDQNDLKVLFIVDHDDGIIKHREAFRKLDLIVYVGAFQNQLMDLAHIVLPIAAFHEYAGTYTAADRRVQLSPMKVSPRGGVLPAWEMYTKFALKAGKSWKYKNTAEVFEEIAQVVPGYGALSHDVLGKGFGQPWTLDPKHPQIGVDRPVQKFSFQKIKTKHTAIPLNADFPFSLMVGKAQHYWHQNNLMRKTFIPRREFDATLLLYPQGYIEISPDDAKTLGVRDKWQVKVSSPDGSMHIAVKVTPGIQNRSAYIPYFIKSMIGEFLMKHENVLFRGEETIIPIKIERV